MGSGHGKGTERATAHVDGACSGNPGPGGWGAVILRPDGILVELSGHGGTSTTNNRMEIAASIGVLRHVPAEVPVTIVADSRYVVDGMTSWVDGWKRNGWRKADRKPVQNRAEWEELDGLRQGRDVTWEWVRGHAGDPTNERADALAVAACRASGVVDPGPWGGPADGRARPIADGADPFLAALEAARDVAPPAWRAALDAMVAARASGAGPSGA